jgi:hypothetical protein
MCGDCVFCLLFVAALDTDVLEGEEEENFEDYQEED